MSNRPLRVTLVLAGAIVVLAWGCFSWVRPRKEFDRLLDGDGGVAVRSVVITGQGRREVLDDPESARYMTSLFRAAPLDTQDSGSLGTTYTASVRLESGGTVEVGLYVPEEGWLTLGWAKDSWGIDDDYTYYRVRLPEPVPPAVAEVLGRLREAGAK